MKQYFKYILPFLCVVFGCIAFASVFNNRKMPTKAEFYAKHNITNNTLMPSSFDEEECRHMFMEIYRKRYKDNVKLALYEVEELISLLERDMIPPEQYDGFYSPQPKIEFYNAVYKDNLLTLGLSLQDIKDLNLVVTDKMVQEWHMNMTIQQLEKEGFYTIADTARLVARVGKNIYLIGDYTDCGTAGCWIYMAVKNKNIWTFPNTELSFEFCVANDDKSKYECDIVGGHNDDWHKNSANYAPIANLSDRYYEIWNDYVQQYLQKRDDKSNYYDF